VTLDDVERLLDSKSTKELFGDDPQSAARPYLAACHPDANLGDQARAARLFKAIQSRLAAAIAPPLAIKSPQRTYTLTELLATGDVADVHLAEAGGQRYLFKVSRIHGGAALLTNEQRVLSRLLPTAYRESPMFPRLLPRFIESFPIRDRFQKRANVFLYEPDLFTFVQVKARHPHGVDGRHVAWMFNRLLQLLGFVHEQGIVHGAVLPSHILVRPSDHGCPVIGWGHAVEIGTPIGSISAAYRDWYPPEVLAKRPATPATDIYMAAKAAMYVASPALPPTLKTFLRSCLFAAPRMRPDNAVKLYHEFQDALRSVYGERRFVEFSMT